MYKRPVVQEIVFYCLNSVDQLETVAVRDFGKFNNKTCWHFASDGFGLVWTKLHEIAINLVRHCSPQNSAACRHDQSDYTLMWTREKPRYMKMSTNNYCVFPVESVSRFCADYCLSDIWILMWLKVLKSVLLERATTSLMHNLKIVW